MMHNHNGKRNNSMMWMMIPCLLLLGFLLFFGGDNLFSGGYLWPILIAIFVGAHVWMMFRGHGKHGGNSDADTEGKTNAVEESKTKDEHKKGSCCH